MPFADPRPTLVSLFAAVLFSAPLLAAEPGDTDPLDNLSDEVIALADAARPHLVRVIRPREADSGEAEGPSRVIGSGLALRDGYILTCANVVGPGREVLVASTDGVSLPARVVGVDWRSNIAVLEATGLGLPPVPVAPAAILFPGDFIVSVGWGPPDSPRAAFGTVTVVGGVTLAYSETDMIEVASPIFPGFTGGVALNQDGKAVGLISGRIDLDPSTAILPPGVHLLAGYLNRGVVATAQPRSAVLVLPMNRALEIAEDLIEFGHVERGYLGVQVELTEVTQGRGRRLKGILLHQLVDNAPADDAGLIPGDVILEYAGARVESPEQLSALVNATLPGATIPVRYLRRGRHFTSYVLIEQAPVVVWSPEMDQFLAQPILGTRVAPNAR